MVSFFNFLKFMKEKLLQLHLQMLQDKIDAFQDRISILTQDAQNDAKSSAGDKHETALAMMHLEQEKLSAKIQEYINQKNEISRIDVKKKSDKIIVGSLVQANDLCFFLSEALPKVALEGKTIFALSVHSPLGSLLLGKSKGDEVQVNQITYKIQEIF